MGFVGELSVRQAIVATLLRILDVDEFVWRVRSSEQYADESGHWETVFVAMESAERREDSFAAARAAQRLTGIRDEDIVGIAISLLNAPHLTDDALQTLATAIDQGLLGIGAIDPVVRVLGGVLSDLQDPGDLREKYVAYLRTLGAEAERKVAL